MLNLPYADHIYLRRPVTDSIESSYDLLGKISRNCFHYANSIASVSKAIPSSLPRGGNPCEINESLDVP